MLFSLVLVAGVAIAAITLIVVPVRLASKSRVDPQRLSMTRVGLLWLAGIASGLMTLFILAAAAWGMDTRLPWGLGVYPYLIPALSLPAFLLLRITSPITLSRAFWLLTVLCGTAWYFGDRAERIASGLRQVTDPLENLGMFLNAFTILLVAISVLVQVAAICWRRERANIRSADIPSS